MTIKQFEYFMEVAQQLSFSKAAENLFVSQSALSRSIAALEEELGTVLFFRNRHTVALTPAGMALATSVPKLKSDLDRVVGLVRQTKEGMRGRLNIGIQSGLGLPEVLSSALKYFRESLPFIPLFPQCMERSELIAALDEGKIDFAVTYMYNNPKPLRNATSFIALERAKMHAAVALDSHFGSTVTLRELSEAEIIFAEPEDSVPVARWVDFCRSRGIAPKIKLAANSETQTFMIENGYGVGVFPETHKIFHNATLRQTALDESYGAICSILWNAMSLNPSVDVFIKVISGDL